MLPLGATIMFFVIGIIFMVADVVTDFLNVEKIELLSFGFLMLMFGLSVVCFSLGCNTTSILEIIKRLY